MKKTFSCKKEANDVYGKKGRVKSDRNQSVGAVLISNLVCDMVAEPTVIYWFCIFCLQILR